MKKTDKKFLGGVFLATAFLMGGLHAKAATTTFVFNSETPVSEMISSGQLEIWQDWMNDLLPYVEGNAVTVSFEGLTDISFSVEEPLTLGIVAPENLVENEDYFIDDYGVFYGFYSVNVALQPTCYGATFTVEINTEPTDGVDTINGANAEIYKVYNMNGIEVLSTDDRSKLDNLVPGMYIVNGKKMIIRK